MTLFHGSDIEAVAAAYQLNQEEILNFSSNVSPLGVPESVRAALREQVDCITRYPDRSYTALREAIAAYVGASADEVVVGNGASELISLVIAANAPKHALIVGPTYSEYERAVARSGGRSDYLMLRPEENFRADVAELCARIPADADMLILCNPNNPTSTAIWRDALSELLSFCRTREVLVLIDETYVEFTDFPEDITAAPLAKRFSNLVVIRGTSKYFGTPGLRLGYLIAGDEALREKLKGRQDPWTVSAPAEVAGCVMFSDTDYIAHAGSWMSQERSRIVRELETWKRLRVFPPEANFVLLELLPGAPDAAEVFDACIRDGMMIRNCSTFPSLEDRFIRFCFLGSEENDRLLAKLRDVVECDLGSAQGD